MAEFSANSNISKNIFNFKPVLHTPIALMPQFGNFSASNLQVVNPRLTEDNYGYWRAQVLLLLLLLVFTVSKIV